MRPPPASRHAPLPNLPRPRYDYLKENHCRERSYFFDHVFGGEAANTQVYATVCAPLVDVILAGKHATCFAYGQTGSGKTHTMLGRNGEVRARPQTHTPHTHHPPPLTRSPA